VVRFAFDLAWRNGFAWSAGGRPLAIFTAVAAVVILAGMVRVAVMAPTRPFIHACRCDQSSARSIRAGRDDADC
jgi:hypothetical protein